MKRRMRIAALVALIGGMGLLASPSKPIAMAVAEDETSISPESAPVDEESPIEDETTIEDTAPIEDEKQPIIVRVEQKYDEVRDWAEEKWNTFIAPLIGGVSITAILSFAMTILMNYLKNKRLDKKLEQANKTFAEAQETLATIKGIYEGIEADKKVNEETKALLAESVKAIQNKMDSSLASIERAERLEPVLRTLAEIEITLAEHSKDKVSSGAAEKIERIRKQLGEL